MRFQVGDRIRITDGGKDLNGGYIGHIGVVDRINGYHYCLKMDNGNYHRRWTDDNDLELINKKGNTMQKLNTMLKLLLGADEKTLYKAGFLNGDLRLIRKILDRYQIFLLWRSSLATDVI